MVKVTALLRDTRNGRTHTHEYEVEEKYAENQLFVWTGHNNACDCNRSRYMYPGDEAQHLECHGGENIIVLDELWVGGEKVAWSTSLIF